MEGMIYVRTDLGKPMDIVDEIRDMEGVKFADVTTGRFDIVVRVECESIEALGDKVVSEIHEMKGVKYTETAPIVG